jgi:hypothetical protein
MDVQYPGLMPRKAAKSNVKSHNTLVAQWKLIFLRRLGPLQVQVGELAG